MIYPLINRTNNTNKLNTYNINKKIFLKNGYKLIKKRLIK